ncbi:DUF4255 domain-containing protein [Candidatus Viridilinea mediisalina]|uniref:Pvc16 N-terminal domain-containing protein n=1 Tax=Candidatus Viridilinea mediisalina TaxID=2024553 RepID=A0A2A6RI26_9CHLR|nr:DUF4255 domain-containing protein [Candidatus Viridilinea mediisalina]PDW02490.1 hypothetical protein CJ255_13675 [Candidatus Viridilinea mediisalina]
MNSPLAAAAVTAVLKGQVSNWFAQHTLGSLLGTDVLVTALPPDLITTGADERPQLNIFLYALAPNTALRRPADPAAAQTWLRSAFALDLHYLLSVYGSGEFQMEALLGFAIQALQRVPQLDREGLQAALLGVGATGAELGTPLLGEIAALKLVDQVAELTITPQFLGIEALTRIWSALQARYRPALTYKVSTVFIGG